MADRKSGGPSPAEPRRYTQDDATRAMNLLDSRIHEARSLDPERMRFDDPQVLRVEGAIRATVRDVFGVESAEVREYGNFRFARQTITGSESEVDHEMQSQFPKSLARILAGLEGLRDRVWERMETPTTTTLKTEGVSKPRPASRDVFVVHGRDHGLKEAVARLVTRLGLKPIILHEQPNAGRTIMEKLWDYSGPAFAIVLLTGDDRGGMVTEDPAAYRARARQNVIFELGLFIGTLTRKRVCVLYEEGVERPSDYDVYCGSPSIAGAPGRRYSPGRSEPQGSKSMRAPCWTPRLEPWNVGANTRLGLRAELGCAILGGPSSSQDREDAAKPA